MEKLQDTFYKDVEDMAITSFVDMMDKNFIIDLSGVEVINVRISMKDDIYYGTTYWRFDDYINEIESFIDCVRDLGVIINYTVHTIDYQYNCYNCDIFEETWECDYNTVNRKNVTIEDITITIRKN